MLSPFISCRSKKAEGKYPGYFSLPPEDMLADNFI